MACSGRLDESQPMHLTRKTMMTTLANRFGASKRDELVSQHMKIIIWTTQNFDNCAEMGMSVM